MYQVNLSLASCFGNQFACGDGSCQPLEYRCNKRKDCLDGSDEQDCGLVELDSSYVKDYSPPSDNEGEKFHISLRVSIYSFLKLSETDFLSSMQFQVHLSWKDARVNFNHLTEDLQKNILTEEEKSSIWIPVIVFHNTQEKMLSKIDIKSTLLVERKGGHRLSPVSQPWKSYQYDGHKNDLHYFHTYSTNFQCDFLLYSYPFDTQECYMIFSLPTNLINLVEIDLKTADYLGDKQLSQFTVDDYHIVKNYTEKELPQGSQVIKFVLKRRFLYQVVTVYIPTFCLLIIMHTTHYYPMKDFEASVMVALTGMLVMTTLLLNVSNNLPPTNYIKLIDVWMLFGMVNPFFDIILHAIVGYYHERVLIWEVLCTHHMQIKQKSLPKKLFSFRRESQLMVEKTTDGSMANCTSSGAKPHFGRGCPRSSCRSPRASSSWCTG